MLQNINIFKAYAKLNLGLKIVGKRADGYHLLNTIFCLVDICDEIGIDVNKNSAEIKLLNHSYPWQEQDDLTYKAAQLLQKHCNIEDGATITIQKNIPVGGGMGGGSSDAATVFSALNKLWDINLSQTELIKLGASLGADIPFFIYGKNAFASGVGEILSPIEIPKSFFVLIVPEFGIATKEIFNNLLLTSHNISPEVTPEYLLTTLDNDLELMARKLSPPLDKIFKDLKNYGSPALTGSGSVVYLRYDNLNAAKKVAQELKNKYNSFLVRGL